MNSVISSEIFRDEFEDSFSSIKAVKGSGISERGESGDSVFAVNLFIHIWVFREGFILGLLGKLLYGRDHLSCSVGRVCVHWVVMKVV